MVNIITISDKILINKTKNTVSDYIAEILFRNNFKINSRIVLSCNDKLQNLSFQKDEIYIFITQKQDNLNNRLSEFFDSPLQVNDFIKNEITNYYKNINEPLNSDAIKSWQIPIDSRAIITSEAKEQGYLIDKNGIAIFVLPLNNDTQGMFETSVLPYILEHKIQKFKSNTIKTFGLSEDNLKTILKDIIDNKYKVSVNIFSNGLSNDIILKAKDTNEHLDTLTRTIYQKLDKFIYTVADIDLVQTLQKLLCDKNIKLSIIESISGGTIINNFNPETRKKFINRCCVIENKEQVNKLFNISNEIEDNIAEMTYHMAEHELNISKPDLVIVTNGEYQLHKAITYIAIGDKNKIDIYKNVFIGTEDEILNNIKNSALFYAIKKIKENDFVFYNK